jgi:hypothetical protein
MFGFASAINRVIATASVSRASRIWTVPMFSPLSCRWIQALGRDSRNALNSL